MKKHIGSVGLRVPKTGVGGMAYVSSCGGCKWESEFPVSQETLTQSPNGTWVPSASSHTAAEQAARRACAQHEAETQSAVTARPVDRSSTKIDKVVGVVAVVLVLAAGYLASAGYTAESTSRRGRSMEEYFSGFGVIFGAHEEYQGGAATTGRLVMFFAVVAVGAYAYRKVKRKS